MNFSLKRTTYISENFSSDTQKVFPNMVFMSSFVIERSCPQRHWTSYFWKYCINTICNLALKWGRTPSGCNYTFFHLKSEWELCLITQSFLLREHISESLTYFINVFGICFVFNGKNNHCRDNIFFVLSAFWMYDFLFLNFLQLIM